MVADVAFLAMCALRLGAAAEARASAERLRPLMNGSTNEEDWSFVREAADAFTEAAAVESIDPEAQAALDILLRTLDERDQVPSHLGGP